MKLTTDTIKRLVKEELSKLLREEQVMSADDILDEYYDEIEYSVLKEVYDDLQTDIRIAGPSMPDLFGIQNVLRDWNQMRPKFAPAFNGAVESLQIDKLVNWFDEDGVHIGTDIAEKEEAQEIVMKAELIIAILALYQVGKLEAIMKDKGVDPKSITKLVETGTFEAMMQAIELVISLFHKRELEHVMKNVLMGVGYKDAYTPDQREADQLMLKHYDEIKLGVLRMVVADLKQNGVEMLMDDLRMAKPSYHKYFQYAAAKAANLNEDPSDEVTQELERSEYGQGIIALAEMIIAIKVLQKQKKLDEFFEMGELYPSQRIKLLNLLNSRDPENITQGLEFLMSIYGEGDFEDILSGVNYERNK